MQHAQYQVEQGTNVTSLRRSPLTPGLASAAKRFGIQSEAVKRHEQFEKERQLELDKLRLQRQASISRQEQIKGAVNQLVEHIQDVAKEPTKAQAGDIQNIRVLLKQAYHAMERQQAELKGIRARTQRMERAAMRADEVHKEVADIQEENLKYQRALHNIRRDMSDLVEIVEGEGGLKDLASQVRHVRQDVAETKERTSALEENAVEQNKKTLRLEQEVAYLRHLVENNITQTDTISGTLNVLRADMKDLRQKVGRYIIDQIKWVRHKD